jgi:signal recognition particle subunit SRP54
MFESITGGMSRIFNSVLSRSDITNKDIDEVIKKIRRVLSDADVSTTVIDILEKNLREKTLGEKVIKGTTSVDLLIKYINDEIIDILGKKETFNVQNHCRIMMCGLQGSGKTTTTAKLASFILKNYPKRFF